MKIIYRLEALADLYDQLTYITYDNPKAAAKVGKRIEECVSRLEVFPFSGRQGSVEDTFELVVPNSPYIVVYRVTDYVEIIAVFHARQNRPKDD